MFTHQEKVKDLPAFINDDSVFSDANFKQGANEPITVEWASQMGTKGKGSKGHTQ